MSERRIALCIGNATALFVAMVAFAGCSKAPDAALNPAVVAQPAAAPAAPVAKATTEVPPPKHEERGIAWQQDDVNAAFAVARSEQKPLFLYWGAKWCPPCNQIKATL